MMLGLSGLVARLWVLQVMKGAMYASKVGTSAKVTVRIPSVRGEIRDRNGIPLVQNRASYNVDFYLPEMVRGFRRRNGALPSFTELQPVKGMAKNVRAPDIVKIVNTGVIPRLQDLDLARDYNAKHLKLHYKHDELVPFTYIEDIDFPTIAKFSEHDVGLPGVDISVKPVREYVYGAFAAHILGYVGMPRDIDQLPDVKNFTFYQPDVEGKSQIELAMDPYLRGRPGTRVMQRNAKGMIDSEVRMDEPKPGANVYLTVDARIQFIVEQALRHSTLGRAAAVVLDPNNGDILATASVPSFDPNIFVPSVSVHDWNLLLKDPAVPLVNRAVSAFPPGSTFKIITALAGLTKGLDKQKYDCTGSVDYGGRPFHCWIKGAHGVLGLADALKVSCDCYFYQYANAAGIESLDQMGDLMGIGHKYDIGLSDVREGCMPGPEWMKARYQNLRWTSSYTANAAIGQGYVLASPLQMAVAFATVANGGTVYEPRLVRTVLTPDGKPSMDDAGKVAVPDEPKIRGDLRNELSKDQIETVRKGLWKVVNEDGGSGGAGTGKKVRMKDVIVAGKTGSAQAHDRGKDEYIAWMCCFAPYDHPKYVVSVMIQGGHHGGGVAGPVAARILRQCVDMDKGVLQVNLKKLAPAHNDKPFELIEALPPYPDSGPLDVGDYEDQSDSAQEAPAEKPQMDAGADTPDIKPNPDLKGRIHRKTHKNSSESAEEGDRIKNRRDEREKTKDKEKDRDNEKPSQPSHVRHAPSSSPKPSQPHPASERRPNLLDRLFHPKRNPNSASPPPKSERE